MAHQKGLTSLSATFISVTDTLALAEATVEFADGSTFSEADDSTQENCNKMVRPALATDAH